jgi:MFS family permease
LFAILAVLVASNGAVWAVLVMTVIVSTVGSMSAPAVSAIVTDVSEKDRLTESYGLMAIGGNLGWAIGPFTGGLLQSHTSYAWVFGVGALITSLSLLGIPHLPKDSPGRASEMWTRENLGVFFKDSTMLFFCLLCTFFYLEMANWGSTLSIFTVDRIGFKPSEYGLLMSISGVLIIIFQYPISRRVEWLGYPKALFLGCFLYGAGFLSLAWVRSFVPAVASVVVLVIGEMLFVPTSYAVVGKISKPEDRAKNMGMLGLYGTVGSSFGPLLGGFLLDRFPANPLYLWGPVALPAFLAALGFMAWRGYVRRVRDEVAVPQ